MRQTERTLSPESVGEVEAAKTALERVVIPAGPIVPLRLSQQQPQGATLVEVTEQTDARTAVVAAVRPVAPEAAPRLRRAVAEMLDRLLPCPFLIAVFPPWLAVALGYQLLCDALPGGASPGKRLMGLRTVHYRDAARACTPARAVLRNLPASATHLMYGVGLLAPLALTLDLVDVLLVVSRPDGRRLGDLLAGTQVTATTATAAAAAEGKGHAR